jgi:hypothetical protein
MFSAELVGACLFNKDIILFNNIIKEILVRDSLLLEGIDKDLLILFDKYENLSKVLESFLKLSERYNSYDSMVCLVNNKEDSMQFLYYEENISLFIYEFLYVYVEICSNEFFFKLIKNLSDIHL